LATVGGPISSKIVLVLFIYYKKAKQACCSG
jgi:hypothetical protein